MARNDYAEDGRAQTESAPFGGSAIVCEKFECRCQLRGDAAEGDGRSRRSRFTTEDSMAAQKRAHGGCAIALAARSRRHL